eukprot:TRINITY_DN10293_c0_g1_i2.p1 TRINITY_DN10293_c0_g1~~TRINITY_DN10293_c0_g1_i2.p1  ORF type:complete len:103 (-),score=30.28 TRINITY_DN10293_c0_g1_i2:304-612(-)
MLRDLCQMPTVNDALKITIVVLRKGLQKIQTLNERIFHLETEISNVKMEKAKKELMLRIGEYVGLFMLTWAISRKCQDWTSIFKYETDSLRKYFRTKLLRMK